MTMLSSSTYHTPHTYNQHTYQHYSASYDTPPHQAPDIYYYIVYTIDVYTTLHTASYVTYTTHTTHHHTRKARILVPKPKTTVCMVPTVQAAVSNDILSY